MKPPGQGATSGKPFEDALLEALLSAHADLQRDRLKRPRRARSVLRKQGRRRLRRERTYFPPSWPGAEPRGRRLALVGILLVLAAVAGGSFALTNLRSRGQKVVTSPGTQPTNSQPLMIFMANFDASEVLEYPLHGDDSAPKVTLSTDISNPQCIIFDSAGDLWVANSDSVVEFAKGQLGNPSAASARDIVGGGLYAGMAFDSSGDLWVDDYGANDVVEYTKHQLMGAPASPSDTTPAPTPAVTIYNKDFNQPFGLAFDRKGDLWIGNEGNGKVQEFTPGELHKSGSPVPKLDITASGISAGGQVEQVAFDSAGNLWTTTGQGGQVVEYTMAQLHGAAAPSPAISIGAASGLNSPAGLYFDSAGNLWVADGEQLVEFGKAQLRSSGSPTPVRVITEATGGLTSVAIGP